MASRLFTPRRRTDCLSVMAVRNRADEPPPLLYCSSPLVLSPPVTGARTSARSPLAILERHSESFSIPTCRCRVKHHAGNGGVLCPGLTLTGALLRARLNGCGDCCEILVSRVDPARCFRGIKVSVAAMA